MSRLHKLFTGLFLCLPLVFCTGHYAESATYVLVHGAWSGGWCWEKVIPFLGKAGHKAVAIDLPGYGLNAKLPKSFLKRPFDPKAFATEPSPVRDVTLQAMADKIMGTIDALMQGGSGPVVLVGHSMGGVPITLVGEMAPEKIKKLVYVSAFMPESNVPPSKYTTGPENQDSPVNSLVKADPKVVGAVRIDPRSDDPAYRGTAKKAFGADVDDAVFDMSCYFLTPDLPIKEIATPVKTTQAKWGSVKRAYISCSEDYAIRPALQKLFIDKADAFTPQNKTEVVTINSSHTANFSHPEELAKILIELAGK